MLPGLIFSAVAALAALVAVLVVWRQGAALARLRLLAEQALAGQRTEAETFRAALAAAERGLTGAIAALRGAQDTRLTEFQSALAARLHEAAEAQATAAARLRAEVTTAISESRTALDVRLKELREGNEAKLAAIHKTVNEQLQEAVEKQMTASFTRVTEQFAQVQKAMGEMQAVGAQIGDLKRLFGNVKTRGGWGEGQVRAMLDDILPEGA